MLNENWIEQSVTKKIQCDSYNVPNLPDFEVFFFPLKLPYLDRQ